MGAGISGVVPAAVGPQIWEEESRTKMTLPGGQDPIPRLKDMDTDGIDVAVLYQTAMLFWFEDPVLYAAACRAYNNWLRDYCSADPKRLYGVGVMPLHDVDASIAEMNRCMYELGFKAVMIPPGAVPGHEEALPPGLRPVLAGRGRGQLPDRRTSAAVLRHAERGPGTSAQRGHRP